VDLDVGIIGQMLEHQCLELILAQRNRVRIRRVVADRTDVEADYLAGGEDAIAHLRHLEALGEHVIEQAEAFHAFMHGPVVSHRARVGHDARVRLDHDHIHAGACQAECVDHADRAGADDQYRAIFLLGHLGCLQS